MTHRNRWRSPSVMPDTKQDNLLRGRALIRSAPTRHTNGTVDSHRLMLGMLVCFTSILACGSSANDKSESTATTAAGSSAIRVSYGGHANKGGGGTATQTPYATDTAGSSLGGVPSVTTSTVRGQDPGVGGRVANSLISPASGGVLVTQPHVGTAGEALGGASSGNGQLTGGKASTGVSQIGGSMIAGAGGVQGRSTAITNPSTNGGKSSAETGSGGKLASGTTGGVTAMGGKPTGGELTGGQATGGTASSSSSLSCNSTLPTYTTSTTVSSTITVSGTKDYAMQRLCADPNTLGDGDQSESQKPVFMLAKGATLKNVIIGGMDNCSAADGVHCESGSCTLENVWIGNVGEDAITFKGNDSSQVMTIIGGGAFEASDKVIQHNGPGTIKVNGFFVKNAGKLYRSCGNCGTQYERHIELTDVFASGIKSVLVGVNANYGDSAKINTLTECGSVKAVCETFTGNDSGDEPTALKTYTTSGDGKTCIFTSANIR